jgi:hypothetical protein
MEKSNTNEWRIKGIHGIRKGRYCIPRGRTFQVNWNYGKGGKQKQAIISENGSWLFPEFAH